MFKTKLIITVLIVVFSFSGLAHAKKDKQKKLPPGLQKKAAQGKALPPGWQKKVTVGETLDRDVYKEGNVVASDKDKGLVTIRVEGKLIRVIENTREIVEILDSL